VGRNGSGKTTILRHISHRELSIPDSVQILHVEQEVIGDDTLALHAVLESDVEREDLLKEEKRILTQPSNPDPKASKESELRLAKIYTRLSEIEADKAEARAASILAGLGFTSTMQQQPTRSFSGGWRMRIALARALFCQPDLLLLDEPTNMLDIKAVLWLENYLQRWHSTLLVVSHDRGFLNAVVTDVIHLQDKKLTPYHGNYDTFERTRNERLRNQEKAHEAQEAHRKHVQTFIDRFRYNAKRASLVQSRLKMLAKMEVVPAVLEDPSFSFSFPSPDLLNPPIISFSDVTFGYPGRGILFTELNFGLDMDSRVALVRPEPGAQPALFSFTACFEAAQRRS